MHQLIYALPTHRQSLAISVVHETDDRWQQQPTSAQCSLNMQANTGMSRRLGVTAQGTSCALGGPVFDIVTLAFSAGLTQGCCLTSCKPTGAEGDSQVAAGVCHCQRKHQGKCLITNSISSTRGHSVPLGSGCWLEGNTPEFGLRRQGQVAYSL